MTITKGLETNAYNKIGMYVLAIFGFFALFILGHLLWHLSKIRSEVDLTKVQNI